MPDKKLSALDLLVSPVQLDDLIYLVRGDGGSPEIFTSYRITTEDLFVDALRSNVTANLTAGFTSDYLDVGTKSSGIFTPDATLRDYQKAVNGGAHVLNPPTTGTGDTTTMVLVYVNNASAGPIDTAGFTKVIGSFTEQDGDIFFCVLEVNPFGSLLTIENITVTDDAQYQQLIPWVIDGGGVAITTGSKGYLPPMPYAGTINKVTLLADVSGSIVIELRKCTYAQFDAGATHPVTGDKINASAPPTLSSAVKSQDSTLTGWTTDFAAGDIFEWYVNSVSTVTRVSCGLQVTR